MWHGVASGFTGAELKAPPWGIPPSSPRGCRRDGERLKTRPRAAVGKKQYRDIQK